MLTRPQTDDTADRHHAAAPVVTSEQRRNYAFVTRIIPDALALVETGVLLGAGLLSYHALVWYSYKTAPVYYSAICFNWLLTLLLFRLAGLYKFDMVLSPRRSISTIFIAVMTTFLLMMAAAFSLKISEDLSRIWVSVLFLSSVLGTVAVRLLAAWLISDLAARHLITRRVAVYGTPAQVDKFTRFAERSKETIVSITAIYAADGIATEGFSSSYPLHRGLDDLILAIRRDEIDDVVLALPWSDSAGIRRVVGRLRELPTNVHLSADIAGYDLGMTEPPSYFGSSNMFQVVGKPLSGWDVVVKTIMDYVIAAFLIGLLSPLLLVVAVLIKLDSPGPVFFRQKRLGFNNRVFDIYKFRSMAHADSTTGPTVQATLGDARITRVGHWLRRSSIDELPQLFNVLGGSMSLVGPRPHALDHNEDFAERIRGYFSRHRAKPGITGLAQIRGFRGMTDTDEKIEMRVKYDIEYIETWSPLLDLKILALTPYAVLFGKNAI